ncbi:hypothetical protein FXO38_12326 [Capsicum annuum]|nr:hypothetical protein FXO38_12326 [Capsicum annuum]
MAGAYGYNDRRSTPPPADGGSGGDRYSSSSAGDSGGYGGSGGGGGYGGVYGGYSDGRSAPLPAGGGYTGSGGDRYNGSSSSVSGGYGGSGGCGGCGCGEYSGYRGSGSGGGGYSGTGGTGGRYGGTGGTGGGYGGSGGSSGEYSGSGGGVSPEKILRLRVRDTKRALTQDASSEEVCVVMSGVIARFDGSDIQNILQRWFRERYSQFWGEKESENSRQTFGRLPYQLWNEKANDGEGAALLKSSHNGATGGYEESLAAVLAKHKHHLASTQVRCSV